MRKKCVDFQGTISAIFFLIIIIGGLAFSIKGGFSDQYVLQKNEDGMMILSKENCENFEQKFNSMFSDYEMSLNLFSLSQKFLGKCETRHNNSVF